MSDGLGLLLAFPCAGAGLRWALATLDACLHSADWPQVRAFPPSQEEGSRLGAASPIQEVGRGVGGDLSESSEPWRLHTLNSILLHPKP